MAAATATANQTWEQQQNDDSIEESSFPHVLWGLQCSPYVYCSQSNSTGLTFLNAAKQQQQQQAGKVLPYQQQNQHQDSHQLLQGHSVPSALVRSTSSGSSGEMEGEHTRYQHYYLPKTFILKCFKTQL